MKPDSPFKSKKKNLGVGSHILSSIDPAVESDFELDDDLVIDDETKYSDEDEETEDTTDNNQNRKRPRPSKEVDTTETIDMDSPSSITPPNQQTTIDRTSTAPVVDDTCFSRQNGWSRMHLSKPLLKALDDLGFTKPTIIQRDAIPLALQGRDVLGTAQTGSGKTAAFLLPVLERLLRSPAVRQRRMTVAGPSGGGVATKVLILLPTRELAVQCFDMLQAISKYTPITKVLVTGGMSPKVQEIAFRQQPDIVVATPGRVLDLLLNSQSVHIELLEIVVLDEADRLLELGFKDECLRVLKHCSKSRQTMLFSATLSDAIKDLAALSLNRPLRVDASSSHSLPAQLEQILVPVPQDDSEVEREAMLLHLCLGPYKDKRTMVFFRTKKSAHRAALIFRLLKIPHGELHGNLTQEKRLEALEKFQNTKSVRILLCSELAARGLDLSNVDLVVNFRVPPDASRYVHQVGSPFSGPFLVGRTARIGHAGTALTLFSPSEKLQIKKIIKAATKGVSCSPPLSRSVNPEVVEKWLTTISDLENKILKILKEEHVERELRLAEMELAKLQNIRDFKDEIMSRPKKQWVGSNKHDGTARDPSQQEIELFAKMERAGHLDDDDSDDEENGRKVFSYSDDENDDSDDEISTAAESDTLHSAPEGKKEMANERPQKRMKTEEMKGTKEEAPESSVKTNKKSSQNKDEKNRLQKGNGKERPRLTPKQRAVLSEHRMIKAIGRTEKKSRLLRRRKNSAGDSEDELPIGGRHVKKPQKKQRRKPNIERKEESSKGPAQPKKITRKMRRATKNYKARTQGKGEKPKEQHKKNHKRIKVK